MRILSLALAICGAVLLAGCPDQPAGGSKEDLGEIRPEPDRGGDLDTQEEGAGDQDLESSDGGELDDTAEEDCWVDGAPCGVCQPSDWYCTEGSLYLCDQEGVWQETPCAGDCSSGSCIPWCQPDERRCVEGYRVEVCSQDQQWVEAYFCDLERAESCDNERVVCLTPCEALEPNLSNVGCTFWPVALANHGNEGYDGGSAGHRYQGGVRLFVSNPNADPLTLQLSDRYQSFDLGLNGLVPPGGSVVIDLPQVSAADIPDRHVVDGSTIAYGAFRLEASLPVFAYQLNPADLRIASSDASLLLPERALGTHYRVMTVPHGTKTALDQTYHHPAGFAVVAIRDDTAVRIRVASPTTALVIAPHETEVLLEEHDLSPLVPDEERLFHLDAHEVLLLETDARDLPCSEDKPFDPEHGRICISQDDFAVGLGCYVYGRRFCQPGADLTGSLVVADRPVAVFATAKNAQVPYYMFGTEHLEEQLLPMGAWGHTFVADRLAPRYRYYGCSRGNYRTDHLSTCPFGTGVSFYRILAGEDDTRVLIRTPTGPVTIEEAPKDFNYYNQVDWTTSPLDGGMIAGLPCIDEDGFCEVEVLLDAGELLEFGDVFNHWIEADRGIFVTRLIPSEEYVGVPGLVDPSAYIELLWRKGGDPAMTTLVPVDQFRSRYAIYVVGELAYGYLGLVAPQGAEILLDEGTDGELLLDTGDGSWEAAGGGYLVRFFEIHNVSPRDRPREIVGASYTDDRFGGGFHTLAGVDGVHFGVQVYGFDHYVSYAYPGGLALEEVNPDYPKE